MLPLKEATAAKHKEAERMPFNIRMIQSRLSELEYLVYLVQQSAIFKAIEEKGLPHPDLARTEAVKADIEELEAKGLHADILMKSTENYCEHIRNMSAEEVLPHIYLNYLALMYGGQMIKSKVPSTGKMYDFTNMNESMMAIRAVQKDEWADEANIGFDFLIRIFEELETYSNSTRQVIA